MNRRRWTRIWGVALLAMWTVACSQGDDNSIEAHCFDQKTRLTLPAFVSTTCPTIADTVTNSPPTTVTTP
jgi:hypothetical protein